VEEHGDTYWYEARACGQNIRERTFVQVIDGEVASQEALTEEDARCDSAEPYLYGAFGAHTLEELYLQCDEIVQGPVEDNPMLAFDAEGIVQTCSSFEAGCNDACGRGFHLAERHFGERPRDEPAP
jgi:hypothetical protein